MTKERKNYKEDFPIINDMFSSINQKRGQVAMFVIIAIVIVGIVLIVLFYPKLGIGVQGTLNPENYLKDCISPSIKSNVELLGRHSGYLNLTEGFVMRDNEKLKYLCYVTGYYHLCVVQDPMVTSHFESELTKSLSGKTRECVVALTGEYQKRGYSAVVGDVSSKASVGLNKINIAFSAPMTITKNGENPQTYKGFEVSIDSQMYELLAVAENIVEYESKLGDSETTYYMQYYPDLSIDKTKLDDGTKIYKLTNTNTKEQFNFASRSLSWPPGLALNQGKS